MDTSINKKDYCKGCGAEIQWILTKSGRYSPANLDGSSHWGTCPKGEIFKKRWLSA
jgi:hypothetical protein